ncbi:MAG: hypothetical protein AAGB28_01455, partial [Pseudomonadota bacterium]
MRAHDKVNALSKANTWLKKICALCGAMRDDAHAERHAAGENSDRSVMDQVALVTQTPPVCVGAMLRGILPDGQNLAGIPVGNNTLLAGGIVACNLTGPCGSILPAPYMHLLFRTPSFRGQACVPHNDLSAFFFGRNSVAKRR